MKAMSFQDPDHRQYSPPGGRPVLHEEMERKDPIIRPSANINVAAILEKANAIRQVHRHLFCTDMFLIAPLLLLDSNVCTCEFATK